MFFFCLGCTFWLYSTLKRCPGSAHFVCSLHAFTVTKTNTAKKICEWKVDVRNEQKETEGHRHLAKPIGYKSTAVKLTFSPTYLVLPWQSCSLVLCEVFFSFRIESNSYCRSQKSPVVSTCSINSTVFMAPHGCGFCCLESLDNTDDSMFVDFVGC